MGIAEETTVRKSTLDALRIERREEPRRSIPAILIALLLLGLSLSAGAAWWLRRPPRPMVRTLVLQRESPVAAATLLNASGYVVARRESTVSSKVTGKVVAVLIEEGMLVETGQELARTDSSNLERSLRLSEAQLESTRSALLETQANLRQAERDLARISRLIASEAASQSELDQAEADAHSLRARLERQTADVTVAECEVSVWRQQLDDTIIRAPFAGVVTSKDAQPGEMISPISAGGGFTRTGICTIVDMDSLEIEVDVSESHINRVQEGLPVVATLDAYPEWAIPAKVIAIVPTADRQKATVRVRVGFERLDPRILPQMSVKVAFQSNVDTTAAGPPALAVPRDAVTRQEGRDAVFVVRDGTVERRAVTVERIDGERALLAAGVEDGERIVIEGLEGLQDGDAVVEEGR